MERRLAAVMIADVAGYGRLSQADEEGTRARFRADLRDVFEPQIAAHRGRLVKTMGDGLLVEFHSVVDAVRCAIEVQRLKAERNASAPDGQTLAFRIGINLGDVIVEGDDIHGDGVNIADRLQQLADPGGLAISGAAYDQIGQKLDVGYACLGEQRVKNIDKPVRVYRVLTDPAAAGRTIGARRTGSRSWRWGAAAAAVAVLLTAGGAALWWRPWEPAIEPASIERMALPLPDKPSIAVLPFANMSGDAQQDYFADGITDDLITELSKVSGLFVISRNSTFVYKGRTIPPKLVSEELGVRYVLEGSVQRADDRLRINAQLIDALDGGHTWADRFDGSLADVFALQDKVTASIADALALRLTTAEQRAVGERETKVPAAYDAFLRGWEHFRRTTPEDYASAVPYLEEAIRLDPDYGRAYAALAMVYLRSSARAPIGGLDVSAPEGRAKARQYLEQARKRPNALAHQVAGYMLLNNRAHGQAIAEFKEAIALDPGDSWAYVWMALALTSAARPAEAIAHLDTAMRLDPHPPPIFLFYLGLTQFSLERLDEAAMSLESATRLNPDDPYAFLALAATYGNLGREQEARAAVARHNELRVESGDVPVTIATAPSFYFGGIDFHRLERGLRSAGVPASLADGEFAAKNRLSADEVRALFFGHRLHGRTFWTGFEHAATISTDGIATVSGDWGSVTDGAVEFDGDRLCYVWAGDARLCGTVFRNPGGTKEKENEFIWYNAGFGAMTFSQVE